MIASSEVASPAHEVRQFWSGQRDYSRNQRDSVQYVRGIPATGNCRHTYRSQLYRVQRADLGDLECAKRPDRYLKGRVRKVVYRRMNGALRRNVA